MGKRRFLGRPTAQGGSARAPGPGTRSPRRITISDAISAFLAIREGSKIAPATLRKYRTFTRQMQAFADNKGYLLLAQFTTADVDAFYESWKLGARAKGKALGTLRAFFRFAMNREWLTKNPVSRDLKPPLGANRVANKVPFTDAELQRIIDGGDRLDDLQIVRGSWWNAFEDSANKVIFAAQPGRDTTRNAIQFVTDRCAAISGR